MSSRKISVIGLGYVGLPVAVAFGEKSQVIGFDISRERVSELKNFYDRTLEISEKELRQSNITFTNSPELLKEANFHIITVPTPIDEANRPNFAPLISASEILGSVLKAGDIVVYESTVYPGATEEVCAPILEKFSGLKSGIDFKVGYSPERINPGDKEHTFKKIKKIVSAQDADSLSIVASVYESVVQAGIFKAGSIKIAEAAKVIENIQRDINISFMNELAVLFNRLGIDTMDVLKAAETKWNFLPFRPGLVGGHCIGVDPYYLTHKAESVGYKPEVILAGRRINNRIADFIGEETIRKIILNKKDMQHCNVLILGIAFKENCPDLRNSKAIDIIKKLTSFGVDVQVYDPFVCKKEAKAEYGIDLVSMEDIKPAHAIIVAVPHKEICKIPIETYKSLSVGRPIIMDVKSILDRDKVAENNIDLWRL